MRETEDGRRRMSNIEFSMSNVEVKRKKVGGGPVSAALRRGKRVAGKSKQKSDLKLNRQTSI
jgi:hypothetical protein